MIPGDAAPVSSGINPGRDARFLASLRNLTNQG
jgi:hypothetical protein